MSVSVAIAALVGVLGLLIGSFLNVVIYRVPRGESILLPASHCPACDTPIKLRHNAPVLSWLWLRGRCASCRVPISARYPLVELGTGLLFAALTLRHGPSAYLPAYLYLAAVGVTLALIDLDDQRLPDAIVLPSYALGVLLLMPAGAVAGDWRGAERALVGLAALSTIYLILAATYPRAMDAGLIKLAGLLGLFLGWLSWQSLLLGTVGGFVVVGAGMALTRTGRRIGASSLPLGLCLLAAAGVALFAAVPSVA